MVPPARHLLRAKDLADGRYFEPLPVVDLARVLDGPPLTTNTCAAASPILIDHAAY